MSVERIKQARQLLEIGEISQEEFDKIKASAMAEMGMETKPPKSDTVGGETQFQSSSFQSGSSGMFDGSTTVGSEGLSIGQYQVLELLGEGGMGSVYRGRHKNMVMAEVEGDVAIKLIKPELAKDAQLRTRFVKEAALGKKIVHPNVAKVIAYHEDDHHTAFIMEYIDGKELKEVIPKGGFSPEETIDYLKPLADAVDLLHKQGIIHRDLKPANIKIRPDGSPVILDFGIAKEENSGSSAMTKTGMAMGTEAYMAPEQMNAKHVDGKADQYSFAMIAYEMLSGRLPWDEETTGVMISVAKMTNALKTLHSVSSVGEGYSSVVMKGLSLSADERFGNCVAFVEALERVGAGPSAEELEVARIAKEKREKEQEAARIAEEQKVAAEQKELQKQEDARIEEERRKVEEQRLAKERRIAQKEKERLEAEQKLEAVRLEQEKKVEQKFADERQNKEINPVDVANSVKESPTPFSPHMVHVECHSCGNHFQFKRNKDIVYTLQCPACNTLIRV